MGVAPVGHIFIVGKGDEPPWLDIADKIEPAPLVGLTRYAILEGGMTSGATSITIAFPLSEGRWVSIETSLAMLAAVVVAARGAEERWKI